MTERPKLKLKYGIKQGVMNDALEKLHLSPCLLILDFKPYIEKVYPISIRVNRPLTGVEIKRYVLEAAGVLKDKNIYFDTESFSLTRVYEDERIVYFMIDLPKA